MKMRESGVNPGQRSSLSELTSGPRFTSGPALPNQLVCPDEDGLRAFTAWLPRRGRQWRAAPAFEHRELRDRLALEPREWPHRPTERHDSAHRAVPRDTQELLHLRLLGHRQGGDSSAKAFMARRQQDVPREGIDRRPADHPYALQVLIRRRYHLEIDADDEHHRRPQEWLRQPGRRAPPLHCHPIHPPAPPRPARRGRPPRPPPRPPPAARAAAPPGGVGGAAGPPPRPA